MRENSQTDAESSAKPTVLLVDDEESILSALRRLLRREPFHILTASGGQAGLDELARNRVDVIVSDQRMPGMSGIEFLRRAKELYPDTVRIVLSGYADLQSITDAINEGAIYKFLSKPWDDDQIKAEIAEAFRRKAEHDAERGSRHDAMVANAQLTQINVRLQDAVVEQRRRAELGETALAAVQEIINCLPTPLLGVDADGLLVFANSAATRRFGARPLLGANLAEALPPAVAALLADNGGDCHLAIDGCAYTVTCHVVDSIMAQRGYLLVFMPNPTS